MLNAGFVNLGDSAWHDGLTEWQPLNQVLKLSPPPPQPALPVNDQRAQAEPINVRSDTRVARQSTNSDRQTAPATSWQSDLKCALRWLLFIPGGLIGGMLLSVPVYLLLKFLTFGGIFWFLSSDLQDSINRSLASAFGMKMLVEMGCLIAPSSQKVIPAKIIGAISIIIFALGIPYYAIIGNWGSVFLCLVSVFALFYSVRSKLSEVGLNK